MPLPPQQDRDPFSQNLPFYQNSPFQTKDGGFWTSAIPGSTGLGTRMGTYPNYRPGVFTRNLIRWMIPEGPIVQMYINPQNIDVKYRKDISRERTKGGFVIQYWGEALTELSIRGTTGTSGIEGINVLLDVYRNEQLAFDPYALYLASKNMQESTVGDVFGIGSTLSQMGSAFSGSVEDVFTGGGSAGSFFGDDGIGSLFGIAENASAQAARKPPTLASLAATVEMYWSGEVYRGFFTDFGVTESAQRIGLFDYTMSFVATQKRGLRKNFFAWHRSAVHGPSNSDPNFGTPHSFGKSVTPVPSTPL
jgi:hypothetical protein